ncbi:GTPase Era [Ruminococcaceae bacterium OttesenSCG-928-A16]|nr:GTPase Era [Ruminococcaceae bacterium OttesenSCG-928-A16]
MNENTKSIFVAIVGRPNVGKSSLLNRLVGEKVAIVTAKPQTTRNRITGIVTKGPVQYVFMDTPGIHPPHNKLGQRMAKTAQTSVAEGDAVLMLFEPFGEFTQTETEMIAGLKAGKVPAIAVVNKADTAADKEALAPKVQALQALNTFESVEVASAQTGQGCEELFAKLANHAVEGPHYFSQDDYTDLPEKQLVAEIIREKLLLHMQQEIPHGTAVEIERFKEREDKPIVEIDATIFCEKKSHKGMIIGKGGQMLKTIASEARVDIEELLGTKVHLQCWVKIKSDWRDNDYLLNSFGFAK